MIGLTPGVKYHTFPFQRQKQDKFPSVDMMKPVFLFHLQNTPPLLEKASKIINLLISTLAVFHRKRGLFSIYNALPQKFKNLMKNERETE
jgi:hypothetical protein